MKIYLDSKYAYSRRRPFFFIFTSDLEREMKRFWFPHASWGGCVLLR